MLCRAASQRAALRACSLGSVQPSASPPRCSDTTAAPAELVTEPSPSAENRVNRTSSISIAKAVGRSGGIAAHRASSMALSGAPTPAKSPHGAHVAGGGRACSTRRTWAALTPSRGARRPAAAWSSLGTRTRSRSTSGSAVARRRKAISATNDLSFTRRLTSARRSASAGHSSRALA